MTPWEYIIDRLPEVLKYTDGQRIEEFEERVYRGEIHPELLVVDGQRVGFFAYKIINNGKDLYVSSLYLEPGAPREALPDAIGIIIERMRQFGATRVSLKSPRVGWLRRLAKYKPNIEFLTLRFYEERQDGHG